MWIEIRFDIGDRVVVRILWTREGPCLYDGERGRVVNIRYGGSGKENMVDVISVELDGRGVVDFPPKSLFFEDGDALIAVAMEAAKRKVAVRVPSP